MAETLAKKKKLAEGTENRLHGWYKQLAKWYLPIPEKLNTVGWRDTRLSGC